MALPFLFAARGTPIAVDLSKSEHAARHSGKFFGLVMIRIVWIRPGVEKRSMAESAGSWRDQQFAPALFRI